MLNPQIIAHIRTGVPMAVGAIATFVEHFLARRYGIGVTINTATVATIVTPVVAGVYYAVVRRLERLKPSLGWLLGYPSQPAY